jgi:hypothetical protein
LASIYEFYLRLETNLEADEYLKVIFPYALHGIGGVSDVNAALLKPILTKPCIIT